MFWAPVAPAGPLTVRLTNTGTDPWPADLTLLGGSEESDQPYLRVPPDALEPLLDEALPALAPGESVDVVVTPARRRTRRAPRGVDHRSRRAIERGPNGHSAIAGGQRSWRLTLRARGLLPSGLPDLEPAAVAGSGARAGSGNAVEQRWGALVLAYPRRRPRPLTIARPVSRAVTHFAVIGLVALAPLFGYAATRPRRAQIWIPPRFSPSTWSPAFAAPTPRPSPAAAPRSSCSPIPTGPTPCCRAASCSPRRAPCRRPSPAPATRAGSAGRGWRRGSCAAARRRPAKGGRQRRSRLARHRRDHHHLLQLVAPGHRHRRALRHAPSSRPTPAS